MAASLESLKKLHTTLIDVHKGYEESIKDTDNSNLAALCREMIALRDKHHAELHQALVKLGEKPDDSGSFMSTVQKVVIDVRTAVTGLNENALPSFIRGEENILGLYDQALKDSAEPWLNEILLGQKQAIQAEISKMNAMQAA